MEFFKAKVVFFLLMNLVLCLGLGSKVILAQKFINFSTSEDVAIAFYKTGGVKPNFKTWIKERDPYKHTPVARRPQVMDQEFERLQRAYSDFKPESDFLTIRTYVSLSPEQKINSKGKKTYNLPITFINAPDALYFPYDFMEQRIVVMPAKLDKLMNSDIDESQYNFIKEAIKSGHKQTMIVTMRANKADLDKPYDIDGLSQWALTADVVSMEIWDKNKRFIWEYSAPWYLAPEQQKLNDLYADRPTESLEKGSVKSAVPYMSNFEN
jgi:hypothetical protein